MHMDDVMPLMYIDEKGKALKSSLSLSDVNQVLIGLYVDEGFIPSSEILYRVHALIVVFHEKRMYFKRCRRLEEFIYWVDRFEENDCLVRYTTYDLSSAFHAHQYVPVDFSRVPYTDEDVVSSVLGTETTTAEWGEWHCEHTYDEVRELCRAQTVTRTRIAETFSFVYLFLYNIIIGCFLFPLAPIHSSGIIVFTDMIIVTFVCMNVLVPIVCVFWRRFTRRFLPCMYTFISFCGGFIGVVLTLNISNIFLVIGSLLIIYAVNFFLWSIGMIGIKLCKLAIWFIRGWEFVR